MDDLRFEAHFNSITVISGRWMDDNERLHNGTQCTVETISPGAVRSISRPALNPLSYRGSSHRWMEG